MNKILVKLDYCWADEFDVNSLWITTIDDYHEFLETIATLDISEYTEIYFGTNEYISFYSYDELVDSLDFEPISDEFYNEFMENIGETYGLISIPDLLEDFGYIEVDDEK